MRIPEPKHDHEPLIFPKGFLWGAATSAFQVEGNNVFSDWWEWEQKNEPEAKRSGAACNEYELYEQDFELAKSLGHQVHRLSIEWARIEPRDGEFNLAAIEHYKNVLKSLKNKGFIVMLTIHHFTNPIWFANKGGWLNGKSAWYIERFAKRILPEIEQYVDFWITLNEPGGYAYDAYGRGKFPPNIKGVGTYLRSLWNLASAHKKLYKLIHQLQPKAQVGIAHNVTSFNALHKHNLRENLAVWIADKVANHLLYTMTGRKTHDFLALNYYYNSYFDLQKSYHVPHLYDIKVAKKDISDLGWEVRPEGIFDVLMDFSDYKIPMYITENGIASTNDDRRVRFLLSYLQEVYHAISAGADIRGYVYWSLLDNYEWVEGFDARFGLVEVDFDTQERIPRPSAYVYKDIIKHNGIRHELLKLLGHGIRVKDVVKAR